MSAAARPDHPLTLAEWAELPEDDMGRRYELAEGVPSAVPRPAPRHQ
ncbi:hypothetical protein [Amycolatopsis rhizosphaerae]|nr:hypothetical protein [Amycolatopsis rhizosphaerae]